MTNKILIVDAMNTFIRNYVTNPALDSSGEPIGGCWGFLRTLQKLVREIDPSKVFIVWDGDGGSAKRRSVTKQYKDGRKPLKLNRAYDNMSTIDETQNRYNQMMKTVDYLNEMPVVQLMADGVEADDVIGFICNMQEIKQDVKIIVSMDKDFYQLCDDKTIVYSPVKNRYLTKKTILEDFGVHPNNFALARAMDGDKSDNLDGVKGVGMKTIAKRLSFLSEEKSYTLDELFKHCRANNNGGKFYQNILSEKKKVETNYKLMQLYVPMMSPKAAEAVRSNILNFEPTFNQTQVTKMMIEDGINQNNWEAMFQKFRMFVAKKKDYLHHPI